MSDNIETQKPQGSEANSQINNINNFSSDYEDGHEVSKSGDWYILRNNNHLGPFTQKKILEYFYQGVLNEYSLIWKESFKDWSPLKKVDEIYGLVKPTRSNDISLPDLPDIRLIELEAQRELEKQIPPPRIKKSFHVDTKKRNLTIENLEQSNYEFKDSFDVKASRSQKLYQSEYDEETNKFSGPSVFDITGTRVSLPPIPSDEDELEEIIQDNPLNKISEEIALEKESKKILIDTTPEIEEHRENSRWLYNFLMVGLVALFVTIPLFYIVISNRPVLHSIANMSKEGNQRINLATSETYNSKNLVFNMALTSDNHLYAGINRSGRYEVKGSLTPVKNKVASNDFSSIVVKGDSVSGLVRFSKDGVSPKPIPVGLYQVSLNLIDKSNIGKLYQLAKNIPLLSEVNFIKNYESQFTLQREAWLGPHSVFLTKRYVDDYQQQIWEKMSKPFDELYQHYDTLISLIERFNEIYFNITTVKTFEQSKVLFSRKYAREIAPILQMIATETLTEEKLKELALPIDLVPMYKDAFSLIQSVSRSISAMAGDIDLFLSVKKSWNRFVRIEQRNKFSKNLVSFRKMLNTSKEEIEKKVENLKLD